VLALLFFVLDLLDIVSVLFNRDAISQELTVLCGVQAWPSACKSLQETLPEAFICCSMFLIHQTPREIVDRSINAFSISEMAMAKELACFFR